LRKLQKDLAKVISTNKDRHGAEARAKLEAIAKELGYSLAEPIGVEVTTTRAADVAKYRNPENAALTWSGRGRKLRWFVEALEVGTTPRELAIDRRDSATLPAQSRP
jgi:DNA-binding protein H-NS